MVCLNSVPPGYNRQSRTLIRMYCEVYKHGPIIDRVPLRLVFVTVAAVPLGRAIHHA